jgi:hypothetical protein
MQDFCPLLISFQHFDLKILKSVCFWQKPDSRHEAVASPSARLCHIFSPRPSHGQPQDALGKMRKWKHRPVHLHDPAQG